MVVINHSYITNVVTVGGTAQPHFLTLAENNAGAVSNFSYHISNVELSFKVVRKHTLSEVSARLH